MDNQNRTKERELFEKLASKSKLLLKNYPRLYFVKLFLFITFGAGYFFGVFSLHLILILITLLWGYAWGVSSTLWVIIFLSILVPCFISLLRALHITFDDSPGLPVSNEQIPELFKEINSIQKKIGAFQIKKLIITQDFNACVYYNLGLLVSIKPKFTLSLGLPLFAALSPEQLRMIISHELGHLTQFRSRLNLTTTYVSQIFSKLKDSLESQGKWARIVLGLFVNWYSFRFFAFIFPLAHENESNADRVASEITSAKIVTETLVQAEIEPILIEEYYWEPLFKKAGLQKDIIINPYSGLNEFLKKYPFSQDQKYKYFFRFLKQENKFSSLHPTLHERIKQFSKTIKMDWGGEPNAGEFFMKSYYSVILSEFDKQWIEEFSSDWKNQFEYSQNSSKRLQNLQNKYDKNLQSDNELWELAQLTEEVKSKEDSIPYYLHYLEINNDDPDASFALGRIYLSKNDPKGVSFLETTMKLDRFFTASCCQLCHGFFLTQDNKKLAEYYLIRHENALDDIENAVNEREKIHHKDKFILPMISEKQMRQLKSIANEISGIKCAWVCRKKVKNFPEEKCYIILYSTRLLSFVNLDKIEDQLREKVGFLENLQIIYEPYDRKIFKKAIKISEKIK